jgi:hypothetical protein
MDPLATAASAVTIVAGAAALVQWLRRRRKQGRAEKADTTGPEAPKEETPLDTWTAEQLVRIRQEYFATKSVQCPVDKAALKVQRDFTNANNLLALVFCPNCRRSAQSV